MMESKAIQQVPLSRIEVRSNVRERLVESDQVALAGNIAENGVLAPPVGYVDGPKIVSLFGHRRIDAAARAGLSSVPMIVLDHAPTSAEILILQLSENCLRSALTTTERARAYERLMNESGLSAAEVAIRVRDASEPMICKLRTLLVFSKEVQDHIDAGRIPISSAYAIAAVKDAAERQRLIADVLAGSLKRDQLVKRIKGLKSRNHQPSRPRRSHRLGRQRVTVPLGAGRAITVAGPDLNVDTLITWLDHLLNRIKRINAPGVGLRELGGLLKSFES